MQLSKKNGVAPIFFKYSFFYIFYFSNILSLTYSIFQIFFLLHILFFKYSFFNVFYFSNILSFTYSIFQIFFLLHILFFKYSFKMVDIAFALFKSMQATRLEMRRLKNPLNPARKFCLNPLGN